MKTTPWLVVGAGAIGMLVTCKLKHLDQTVHLVYRSEKTGNAITLDDQADPEYPNGKLVDYKIKSFSPDNLTKQYDKVIFCTKAFDLVSAYQQVQEHLTDDADICCLCNGMGAQQELAAQIKSTQTLWAGTTSEGALKLSSNKVKHTGKGDTFFGLWNQQADKQSFHLEELGVANIHQRLLEKLAINAVINPITALFAIQNGDVLNDEYSPLLKATIKELSDFFTNPKFEYYQHSQHLTQTNMTNRITTVAKLTHLNRSSMHEDIRLNRPTENEYISGYLAATSNHSLPIQEMLYQAINNPEQREETKKKLLSIA